MDNRLKSASLYGTIIYCSGIWIIATEVVLEIAQLYSSFDLNIEIYVKAVFLTITGLTSVVIVLLNYLGINFVDKDENSNNESNKQKVIKNLTWVVTICFVVH